MTTTTLPHVKRGIVLYCAVLSTLSAALIHFVGLVKQTPSSIFIVGLVLAGMTIQVLIAIGTVIMPRRNMLIVATVVEGVATLVWIIAHSAGLLFWRPETLGTSDLYLLLLECISMCLFFNLAGRNASRHWRLTTTVIPILILLGVAIFVAAIFNIFLSLFLIAEPPVNLEFSYLGVLLVSVVCLVVPVLRRVIPDWIRTLLLFVPVLPILYMLTWGGTASASTTVWLDQHAAISATPGQKMTVAYCMGNVGPLAMDISIPSSSGLAPAVLYIHGGATLVGSRMLEDGGLDGVYLARLRDNLLDHGFVAASIDYTMAPLATVSDELVEAQCAIRFLRDHSQELRIDPQRIGVYGTSQGGYLAAMLGTMGPGEVQAVVDMWGPTDLTNFSGSPLWITSLMGNGETEQLRAISPVSHISPDDPPFLIIHGTDDPLIAPHHSQNFAKLLKAAGVPVTLVMIENDAHGLVAPTHGQPENPSPDAVIHMIADFFIKTLGA